jgi:hypothetical protein
MARLRSEAETKAEKLYKRIAAMSKREKVMAGARVYAAGFVLPFARVAGMYDELVQDYGLNEIHPAVDACYDTIVSGVATEMIPRLFLTGSWANDVPEQARETAMTTPGEYEVLQAIWTRGFARVEQIAVSTAMPESDVSALVAAAEAFGFVKQRSGKVAGASLTPAGRARLVLLAGEALTCEHLATIASAYDAFLAPNQELKALVVSWQKTPDVRATLSALESAHAKVADVLERASGAQPRFRIYLPRLERALEAFRGGDTQALARPLSDSYHDIWMELHEDMLKTMGRTRSKADGA